MKLNMRAGEIGLIIKGSRDFGRVVRVDRLLKEGEAVVGSDGRNYNWRASEPTWILSDGFTICLTEDGRDVFSPVALDSRLRPIRDSDGEDETLTWAGKPEKKEKETT